MAWALGWGLFEDGSRRAIFHVGREEGGEHHVEAFLDRQLGVVVLSLMTGPDSFPAPLVEHAIGAASSPLDWLDCGEPVDLDSMSQRLRRGAAGIAAIGLALLTWRGVSIPRRRLRR
jgi:hypothetical protein